MGNVIRLNYDGKTLPSQLNQMNPRFLLEAIPEILDIKKAHYELFRSTFPEIEIRSVTSGFPARELGVGVAHPAFPHEINKMWEIVESEPSPITQLLWALGLMPIVVSDDWSFVLDVLFCGITLAGLRHHHATNMPFWKIDKYVRKFVGPNPFRAHDAIGAAGANFLTWSCLHHLSETYGEVFRPTPELDDHKDTGQNWYPLNHFRPLVDWKMDEEDEDLFKTWILGPLFQMTSLMLHENRGHLSHINAIGEICAQFRSGILAMMRNAGADSVIKTVEKYHSVHPEAAGACWYPDSFADMSTPEWQQLYVNAEHDGNVGVISINRESYNSDVNQEMNSAIDWLKGAGIESVIVTGDFHLSTQLVGADTSEFYPALEDAAAGASPGRAGPGSSAGTTDARTGSRRRRASRDLHDPRRAEDAAEDFPRRLSREDPRGLASRPAGSIRRDTTGRSGAPGRAAAGTPASASARSSSSAQARLSARFSLVPEQHDGFAGVLHLLGSQQVGILERIRHDQVRVLGATGAEHTQQVYLGVGSHQGE